MIVTIPDYLTKVPLTKGRRKTYFLQGSELPKKFKDNSQFAFKKGRLWDITAKEFVVKNASKADQPRMKVLNGNDLMRAHPQVWFKCFEALKHHFMEHIGNEARLRGFNPDEDFFFFNEPISVEIEIRAPFNMANWDIDGMWFYHKCLLDAIRDLSLIPNDNIIHVREAGKTRFLPCTIHERPEMTIVIQEVPKRFAEMVTPIHIIESMELVPGEVRAEMHAISGSILLIGIGKKKIIYGKAKTAIRRAMQYCLDNLYRATVSEGTYTRYVKFFDCFTEHRIPLQVITHEQEEEANR